MNVRFLLAGSLFVVSFLWPSEGAINGDGLQWAVLWIAAAAYSCWQALRSVEATSPVEIGWGNLLNRSAAFVVVAGVWVSTAYVFQIGADRRSAFNVACEWTAISAASVLFWQLPAVFFRQQFGRLLVGLALGLAIMGILQHHVVWAQRSSWFMERIAAIDNWEQSGAGATAAKQAEADLLAEQVPLTGSAAETFRRRLLDSTEAIGPFALANTLGGFLAAGLVLLVGSMCSAFSVFTVTALSSVERSKSKWWGLIVCVLWAVIIGYALVLTKSRTAWVATGVGIVWLLVGMRRAEVGGAVTEQQATEGSNTKEPPGDEDLNVVKANSSVGKTLLVVSLVASGLFVAGMASGAIDREVLLESPKSLRYRLMYWMGTSDLLADRLLFGTGPGNFRNTYLQYKLPDASEQILDPHNLPLDVYCSAGLLGVLGLLLLLGTAFFRKANRQAKQQAAEQIVQPQHYRWRFKQWVAVAGYATVLFVIWDWFNGADVLAEFIKLPDGGLLVLAIPVSVVLGAATVSSERRFDRTIFQAAFVALLVHLLGAGAFQITSVGLMLMCLHRGSCLCVERGWKVGAATVSGLSGRLFGWSWFYNGIGLVVFSLSAVFVVAWGLMPVRAAQRALSVSRMAEASGRVELAVSDLDKGISADELAVRLRQRKAEVLAYAFMAKNVVEGDSEPNVQEMFLESERVFAACDEWSEADSTGYRPNLLKSQVLERLGQVQQNLDLIQSATIAMSLAVEKYPTSAELLSRLAMLQATAEMDREARITATKALKQDEINRSWGHAELYLAQALVDQLNEVMRE